MSVLVPEVLSFDVLDLDYAAEADRIGERLRAITARQLHRRGLVVAISGGIDSSCSIALAVRALGPERVYALILPERDSSDDSAVRATILAEHLGVRVQTVDIAPALAAIGCYAERDAAVRRALPEYGEGWRFKIVIDGGVEGRINQFRIVAVDPDGGQHDKPLGLSEYLQIVAATNFKQRIRKTLEYYHADRLNYAVVGTPNRLEYDQGFFVKNGDGSADVKPIAHLYKSQVYGMARFLGLPERVCAAVPTTDTYSLEQGQDEFYFALPYRSMDLALWALNHGRTAEELAPALDISVAQANAVYDDIRNKRRTTRYMHLPPVLVGEVAELDDLE
ncbi:NAD(+) synthase [Luteimonas sp. RIT-PG2_3]